MPQVSTNKKYTITSSFIGPSNNLASTLNSDTVIVESSDLKASQQWYFTLAPVDGYYYFHTSQKGDYYTLDIRGYDGEDTLSIHFHDISTEGRMVGQYWMIGEWSDGSARISNNFTGADVLLDVEKVDGEFIALLANADQKKTGQKWSFDIVGVEASTGIATQTLSTASATATNASVTSTLFTSTSTPTQTSTGIVSGSNEGLSKGTIAGIAVAGVVGLVLLAGLGFLIRKCLRRNDTRTDYDPRIPMVSSDA